MIHQLRIYEIFEHNREAFHARFRDHAARIMAHYGFRILAMWECRTEQRLEFVYLLAWPDETALESGWSAFMADEEWRRIKDETHAEHGFMVGSIEDRRLRPAGYGPTLGG
ncbi:NIPSNAP protein [Tistlia consotensis]|uniref:NIPSNAP protein n=1 Tax=Tistlia consotensis USBA 355 TaxID=560819 RepID=A0A1Y6BSH2_9PROT|nr:NIPSNAP family protein [Tistlia consotensis]SMF18839.1 NIPSNAP protein [Tistlia consotensis USBA 355]SNR39391.1 NIPSNAP protein [Tistlia consotensis]